MNNEIQNKRTYNDEVDLLDLLQYILKRWIIVVLCTIFGMVASGLYTKYMIRPVYSSSSLIYVRGSTSSITSLADIQIGYYLTDDCEVILKSRPVLEKVIKDLDLSVTYQQLSSAIAVTNDSGRNVLRITARSYDPNVARDVVNLVVKYGVDIIKEINTREPYIIEEAVANPNRVSPSMSRNIIIGGAAGLVISAGFFAILYLINDRISDAETIENKIGIPVIGSIPESASLAYEKKDTRKKKKRFFNKDKEKK